MRLDELELELDGDVSTGGVLFRGTGSPGRPSNLHMFYEPERKSVAEMLKEQNNVELLVTEAQVLRARAEKKEKEAMKKGLR